VSTPVTAGAVTWVDAHFALYRGMRDAGKWAAILAFVYSQLGGIGASAIEAQVNARWSDPRRADLVRGLAAALLLAVPLYYGNGLLFGAHGEIKPSQYSAGCYPVHHLLTSQLRTART